MAEMKLTPIPEKRYFTIGEASQLCNVETHVLRYWEKEFPQLSPVTRRGNRRYYQQKDVLLIRQIKSLLYEEGFTISGARQKLVAVKVQEENKAPNFMDQICRELELLASLLKVKG